MAQVYPHLHIVILCEDYGERLWPLARQDAPVYLSEQGEGGESLLAAAVRRGAPYTDYPIRVITTEELADAVQDELALCEQAVDAGVDLLAQPYACGSAFALALACARIRRADPQAVVLAMRAGQRIDDDDRWEHTIYRAYQIALQDRIVVLGGEQGDKCLDYTYIRKGKPLEGIENAFEVRLFAADQPPVAARRQHDQGAYWYTGCLVARAALVLGELSRAGEMAATEESAGSARIVEAANFLAQLEPKEWLARDAQEFIASLPGVSFEKAVLEVSGCLVVLPTTIRFSALRSLSDLDSFAEPTREGNRVIGEGAALERCRNTTVFSKEEGRQVVAVGLRDCMVIELEGMTLVVAKDQLDSLPELARTIGEQTRGDNL